MHACRCPVLFLQLAILYMHPLVAPVHIIYSLQNCTRSSLIEIVWQRRSRHPTCSIHPLVYVHSIKKMADTQISAATALLLGATIATAATLITLYVSGAFVGRSDGQQPDSPRGRPSVQRNGTSREESASLKRRGSPRRQRTQLPSPVYFHDEDSKRKALRDTNGAEHSHAPPAKSIRQSENGDNRSLHQNGARAPPAQPTKPMAVAPTFRTPTPSKSAKPSHSHSDLHSPRHMRPIATPASTGAAPSSPRTVATSTSRPGSPIAATQTLHVTSRSRADGATPPAPPPPHMMLQTNPSHAPAAQLPSGLQTVKSSNVRRRGAQIEAEALGEDYHRVITAESTMTDEEEAVCHQLVQALDLRWKWLFRPTKLPEHDTGDAEAAVPSALQDPHAYVPLPRSECSFRMVDGVIRVFSPPPEPASPDFGDAHTAGSDRSSPAFNGDSSRSLPGAAAALAPDAAAAAAAGAGGEREAFPLPGTDREFFTDMLHLSRLSAAGPVMTYCHHRLTLLEQKFNLHVMLNAEKERLAQKTAPHRDLYNVRKVDTHVHHSACMHQKHLLRFIKSKLKKEPDEIVIFRDGKFLTLLEVFESLNLTAYDLNVDTLDMHADKTIFHRFDRFNLKYNPFGQSRLREVFIKQDNLLHGRFLAEVTKEVFSDLEDTKYQHTEYRISIYGRKTVEWDILAAWVCQNKLHSDKNVWLIQVPRLYNVYKAQGLLENFEQMLDNLFRPLFEVTADPSTHPQLHVFLQQVVGFDCVDDESKPERRPTKHMPKPVDWNNKYNAAYSYYIYYLYSNLYVLNNFRQSRGLNTFTFRPHCGEAGELDHLASAFMVCDNIAHGINLRKSPVLQYIYYLAQVGLCMSPLSNNHLFLDYHRNPFPAYFARGLSVSLSTDDPLQIHLTKEPLVEEYSVAANMWKLTTTDLCEIARNSVLHSGFPHECKKHWLCTTYWKPGPPGNDIQKTNVPNLRIRFRFEAHQEEMRLLYLGTMEHVRQGSSNLRLD
eukprot:jgi/Ulvmu1/9684/UM055_0022.1